MRGSKYAVAARVFKILGGKSATATSRLKQRSRESETDVPPPQKGVTTKRQPAKCISPKRTEQRWSVWDVSKA
ncbi:MAG: hypothetical protein LBF05_03885 [Tannerella sp.]|jgi:hypothetical protein|nr:hypothetical protein [Tannerella sp.]